MILKEWVNYSDPSYIILNEDNHEVDPYYNNVCYTYY